MASYSVRISQGKCCNGLNGFRHELLLCNDCDIMSKGIGESALVGKGRNRQYTLFFISLCTGCFQLGRRVETVNAKSCPEAVFSLATLPLEANPSTSARVENETMACRILHQHDLHRLTGPCTFWLCLSLACCYLMTHEVP